MPRKARLIVPGAVYHIMSKCLPMYQLFSDDDDRKYFLYLLATYLERTKSRCYAWTLMSNHYHLALRLGAEDLWRLMKPLQMRYAQYHGSKTGRKGPLFIDRYKSIATQDQNYLQELVRYVHLNPIRAGICKDLKELQRYPWNGHSALMGKTVRKFQDTDKVLRRFGKDITEARKVYQEYLYNGLKQRAEEDYLIGLVRNSNLGKEAGRKPNCWVIGDQKFVQEAIALSAAKRLRISRFEQDCGSFQKLAESVSIHFHIEPELLKRRHREGNGSEARKVFAYIAARRYNVSLVTIASFLEVGSAAVSAMLKTGEELVKKYRISI